MWLSDSRVADVEQTCGGMPEQYSGKLISGEPFYFRYRFGYATLAVGGDCEGRKDVGMHHGDGLQGLFDTAEDRHRVFTELLDRTGRPRVEEET